MLLFVAIAMVLMSSVLICCTKDVMSLKFLYSVCNRLYSVCIRLYSFVLRLYPVCTARNVSSLGFLYSFCIPLYSCVLRLYSFVPFGIRFPYIFVLHLYPFLLSPRLANIILLGDGRNTKVQKCANVIQALYWVPVGQTGSLRHAPLPRRRLLWSLFVVLYQRCSVHYAFIFRL